jgi:outer membrane murein-binding lipoprotein Lpp
MLEAILEGQRALSSQLNQRLDGLVAKVDDLSTRHDGLAGKVDELSGKQDELSGKLDELSGRQDAMAGLIRDLTREVRDGFDDSNRKIAVLNSRMLTFETWLTRIDERLHEEIVARTR